MKKLIYLLTVFPGIILMSCHSTSGDTEEPTDQGDVQTPVSVTTVSLDTLAEYIDLKATSTYLQFNTIKAQTNGYLKAVNIQPGQAVSAGQVAFTMKTKEAQALGNTINALDSSFRFSGVIIIHAAVSGYVQELNHQAGDYVQDGEQLAVLTDSKSLSFILSVPFELRHHIQIRKSLTISLPDGTKIPGTVSSILPSIDSASQSEQVLIRINSGIRVPQNIIGTVRIVSEKKESVPTLPKEAILADESQTDFWVMKMIDSATAVRTPISKGMEVNGRVEILSPTFSPADRIIITGNYGLPDTAKVKILKAGQ